MKRSKKKTTEKEHSRFTKVGVAILALALVANVVGLVNTPDNSADEDVQAALSPSYVIEETVEMPPSAADIVLEEDEDKQKQKQQVSAGSILVYLLGWIATLCTGFLGKLLTPLMTKVLGWVIFAAAVFIAIVIALKKAFPEKKLKEILSGKNVFLIILFILAIIAICEVLGYYFKDFVLAVKLLALLLGAILIGIAFSKIRNRLNALPKLSACPEH